GQNPYHKISLNRTLPAEIQKDAMISGQRRYTEKTFSEKSDTVSAVGFFLTIKSLPINPDYDTDS
ncbi:MAG: hypothetical protein ACFCU6_01665, partial [Balneolaceae bacterium]